MATWSEIWTKKFIDDDEAGLSVYNDAKNFGVEIFPAIPENGDPRYAIIGIHKLTPEENGGNHNLYVELLSDTNYRLAGKKIALRRSNQGAIDYISIDKPANEPGGNTPVWAEDLITAWVNSNNFVSDSVTGIHTRHPDEASPGNTLYHHSFFVVWKIEIRGDIIVPPPEEGEGILIRSTNILEEKIGDGDFIEVERVSVTHEVI